MSIGSWVESIFGGGKKSEAPPPAPAPMPQPPTQEDSAGKGEEAKRRKLAAVSRSKSVFSDPLGIAGQAEIVRKQLLGH